MTLRNMCAIYCYNIEKKENTITERIKSTFRMVQAWVGQKLVNVTFYEFFLCHILYKYI
jgi:hypothetical protein